jgi:hypothetical protein
MGQGELRFTNLLQMDEVEDVEFPDDEELNFFGKLAHPVLGEAP